MKVRATLAWLLASSVGFACGAHVTPPAPAASAQGEQEEEHGTVSQKNGIGTYVSIPWGFSTSSYWIEGDTGLIAIDTQFLPSAAEEMIARAEALTKKKFVLAIVLHANPDKFNGTSVFQKHGVAVITSKQVKDLIPEIHEKRTRAFYDRYAPDYPKDLPNPDVFGSEPKTMTVAGVTLRLHVPGPGCSEAHVVVEIPDKHAIFTGDLVATENHSWLEIGKTDAWLTRLAEMKRMSPTVVYPGRGPEGDARVLDAEDAYLRKVIALVAAEKPTMAPNAEALGRVEEALVKAYPKYGFPVFLKIGLPAEWVRQAHSTPRK